MSVFSCLICDKAFKVITTKDILESDRDNTIIATKCGHLFHRTCLDCAFVYQKVKLQVENRPERRHCPFKPCREDVTGFPLIQIKPSEVHVQNRNDIIHLKSAMEELKKKNYELMQEVHNHEKRENEEKLKEGDKVYWKVKEGKYTPATVQELQAKIKLEPGGNSSKSQMSTVEAIRSRLQNFSFTQEQTVAVNEILTEKAYLNYESLYSAVPEQIPVFKRPDSVKSRDSGVSVSEFPVRETSSPVWSYPPSAGVGQQPKWIAGDRVYFPKEKHYATVKWIGYSDREYKLIAGLEYDEPVGDNSLDSLNIPVRYQLGHGKRMDFEELSRSGVKEDINKNVFSRFMFGSSRRKGAPNRSKSLSLQNHKEALKDEKSSNESRNPPHRSFSNPGSNISTPSS